MQGSLHYANDTKSPYYVNEPQSLSRTGSVSLLLLIHRDVSKPLLCLSAMMGCISSKHTLHPIADSMDSVRTPSTDLTRSRRLVSATLYGYF